MSILSTVRSLAASAVLAAALGLSACGSGSSLGDSSASVGDGSATPPVIQTRAELGCVGVDGPLDGLQTALTGRLTEGLSGQSALAATPAQLASLVSDALDLIDATANGAGSLLALGSGGDPQLVTPVLDQLLCVTAAVGEVLFPLTIAVTTPLADRAELIGLLQYVVDLQAQLQAALAQIAAGGAVPQVAGILQEVTAVLAGVLTSPILGVNRLPGGDVLGAVLKPVSDLLYGISTSLESLQAQDAQGFVDALLGSVSTLVNGLVTSLGPLGVVLSPVLSLLDSVLGLLGQLLGGLLGIVL